MKIIISIILYLLTLSSGYIILTIGLGWFWTIGSCENADRINQVLLNLSYSYIAGWIFYLLVTYFPEMQRKITLRPAIQLKIEDLRKQINACIQTFAKNESGLIKVNKGRCVEMYDAESGTIPNSFNNWIVFNLSNFLGSLQFAHR